MEYIQLFSIFSIALIASLGHCIGMCGGIVIAYTHTKIRASHSFIHNALLHLLYVFGRISMYIFLGALVGGLGTLFPQDSYTKAIIGLCISILLLLFGFCYIVFPHFLRIFEPNHTFFSKLTSTFTYLLRSNTQSSFFILGMLNGILPCGIVYFFLISALASGNALGGMMVMGIFGIASALVMYPFALFSSSFMHIVNPKIFNFLAGVCMIGFGGYGIFKNLKFIM